MALPIIRIIGAVTPLVLGAFDLYRRRSEAKVAHRLPEGAPQLAEALQKRMQELEESDLEQARLISELSNNVEALARTLQVEIEEGQRKEDRIRRLLWLAVGLGTLSFILSLWLVLR